VSTQITSLHALCSSPGTTSLPWNGAKVLGMSAPAQAHPASSLFPITFPVSVFCLGAWAVFLPRCECVPAGESWVCPVLCLPSSLALPTSTSKVGTAGWASALGVPLCPRSFLGERVGFYHLALLWGVTVKNEQ